MIATLGNLALAPAHEHDIVLGAGCLGAQMGKFHCNFEHHVHSDTCLIINIIIICTR